MKRLIFVFSLLISVNLLSQNLKVTYTYRLSSIAETEENVFLNGNYKVSITDSISKKIDVLERDDTVIIQDKKSTPFRRVIIDDLRDNTLYFTEGIGNTNYFVSDTPPKIQWNLKHKETKKINNYICKKATAFWRGTHLEAYYTGKIPVSIGPYKFKGLPGLIMEISTSGVNSQYWTINKIEYPYQGAPNFSNKYVKSLTPITVKDFIKIVDARSDEEQSRIVSKIQLPKGVRLRSVERTSNPRGMVEEKYEWE